MPAQHNYALELKTINSKRIKAQKAVEDLDAQLNAAIRKAKAAGLTNADIGRSLGISAEAVAKRLTRNTFGPRRTQSVPTYGLPVEWSLVREKDRVLVKVGDDYEPYRVEPTHKRALGEPEPTPQQITSVAARRGHGTRESVLPLTDEQHAVLLEEYQKMLQIQANRAAGQAKRKQTLGYEMGRPKR